MKIKTIVTVLAAGILFTGCDQLSNNPKEVAFADVTDAYFLGIDPKIGYDRPSNNLVKITSDNLEGSPVPVEFMDGSGDILGEAFSYVHVTDIVLVSPEYTILCGNFEFSLQGGEMQSIGLLLNNFTGALYDLEDQYRHTDANTYLGSKYFQHDRHGNLYYRVGPIRRLVVGDPDQIMVEQYMDYPGSYRDYYIDLDGNIYFRNGELLKLAAGGIIETGAKLFCFTGFDGDIFGFQNDTATSMNLYSLTIDGDVLSKEVVMPANVFIDNYFHDIDCPVLYYPDSLNRHHAFSGLVLMILREGESFRRMPFGFLFDENNSAIYPFEVPEGLSEMMAVFGREDHYFWVCDHPESRRFYVLDLHDITLNAGSGMAEFNGYTEFEFPSHLEIQEVITGGSHMIEFRGYDLEKEVNVTGFLSMAHGLEYVEEDSELGSIILTRIK